ncbi:MAG: YufK family protein [Bacillaceae bacterium]|nr:YufK family protein [Bacillaceae bacterium]
MKNRYITSHFPLFSILLFSISLALFTEGYIVNQLQLLGLYDGMKEFFSESGIKITLLFLLLLFFFMVFSALKLIADTIIQLSLLFFSKDETGDELNKIRSGTWVYLIASLIALIFFHSIVVIVIVFISATFIYFIYFLYKLSDALTPLHMFGLIMFHLLFWFTFIIAVSYAILTLYNSFIASLPL